MRITVSSLLRQPAGAVRLFAVLAAAVLMLALSPPLATAQTQPGVTPARVDGQTRFHTAANIATLTFNQADVAHIVFAEDFPDALAASYGAGVVEGPILLVPRDEVGADSPTMRALEQLGVRRVVLVGGEAAISDQVEQEFADHGFDTDRLAGVNRYQTASSVAMHYGSQGHVGTFEGDRTALLASGEGFADALAAGPIAARAQLPLFLTPSDSTEVSVNRSLEQLDIERIVVIGGQAAVNSDVVEYYQGRGYEVERWSGATRTETAATVADNATERLGFDVGLSLLARGDDFADALAASAHGGANGAPILLTATPTILSQPTRAWFTAACPAVEAVRAIGGTAAVTSSTLGDAVDAAEACVEAAGASCTNPEDDYTVEYPADWATNEDSIDSVPPCSLFDPDPAQIRTEGQQVPADVAVFLRVEPVSFEEASGASASEQELSRRDAMVDGRRAERIEVRHTGEGLYPEGTLTTRWTVDLDGESFIATSHNIGEPAYEEKVRVLDRMMQTVTFRSGATTDQTYGVAPQEPVSHEPGVPHEFSVFARSDDQPFTGPVDIALFPCANVEATASPVHFTDSDGDGIADGIGTSDTAAARIVRLNGVPTDTTVVRDATPADDGILRFDLNSPAADCTVPVVFDDVDDDGQLTVDDNGHAGEPFGVGQIRWR